MCDHLREDRRSGAQVCLSREARYVPWSFGEVFECLQCLHRARQDHRLRALRGEGYTKVYPFPEHERRHLLYMPCVQGFHDICAGPSRCDCSCEKSSMSGSGLPVSPETKEQR